MYQRSDVRAARAFTRCALLCGLALFAAGCDDYLERRDTITLGVGDSVSVNKATQTINRWPRAARQDRWVSDGERARIAVSRYRRRAVPDLPGLGSGGSAVAIEPTDAASGGATTGGN